MSKHLRKFNGINDYNTAKSGRNFYRPSVSLIDDTKEVKYDALPIIPAGFVDLGLPSGTLWHDKNIDATCGDTLISWYGGHYAWGEIVARTIDYTQNTCTPSCNWSNYKYAKGSYNKLTKYCNDPNKGYNRFTDNLLELVAEDDIATQTNADWKMPTKIQLEELREETYNSWQEDFQGIEGLNGMLFISKSDQNKSIFMPAAGYCENNNYYNSMRGCYWSSNFQASGSIELSEAMDVSSTSAFRTTIQRCAAASIRPVYSLN